jgi:hypothetical protein
MAAEFLGQATTPAFRHVSAEDEQRESGGAAREGRGPVLRA